MLQVAGAIIGKGGENIKRLRSDVRFNSLMLIKSVSTHSLLYSVILFSGLFMTF